MSECENITVNDLYSIIKLRTLLKEVSSTQVQVIIDKLGIILNEKVDAEKAEAEILNQKKESLNKILELAKQEGLTAEDLASLSLPNSDSSKPRRKRFFEIKYRWTNPDGTEGNWSGQGKIPNSLKAVMEADGIDDKEYYRIDPEE